jgi:hypothetical protein
MKQFKLKELPAVYKSFDEPYADLFYTEWKNVFKNISRVHGVVGMAQSGLAACQAATDEYFVLIDGDSFPLPKIIADAVVELPDDHTWHKFQSIQGVTKSITPHGALAVFHRQRGIELCTNAVNGTVHCNFQPGFVVVDTVPLSIEFCNQSADIAYRAAYKDCSLLLQDGLDPITYIGKQQLANLQGKRQRIIPWLTDGAGEPNGLYSLYGAHRAVYDVFTGKSVHQTTQDIELFKLVKHDMPVIGGYDELIDLIKPFYTEMDIEMIWPASTDLQVSDFMTRCKQLQQHYDGNK